MPSFIGLLLVFILLAGCAPAENGDTTAELVAVRLTTSALEAKLTNEATGKDTSQSIAPLETNIPAPTPLPDDLVWFAPNFGSTDYVELFTKPDNWLLARNKVDVFKFYTQNALGDPCDICGTNNLQAFEEVDAFRKLNDWGIAISVEVGAVKTWGCTGHREAEVAAETIANIKRNGGSVSLLSMDEPLIYGQLVDGGKSCGQPPIESAAITAQFISQIHQQYPDVLVGDIEPYPHFSAAELEEWIISLEQEGVDLAFFHLDIDVERVRFEGWNVVADLQRLRDFCRQRGIPFGVIMISNWKAAGSNRAYFESTLQWVNTVNTAIGKPDHVIFQSWQGPASSGAYEVPINLPQNDPENYSHVRLILEGLEVFTP